VSRRYRRIALVLPLLLLIPLVTTAAPSAKPTAEQIAQWIRQLGDNRFTEREDASKKLWAAGLAAEAALTEALKSDDVEVVRRARDILDKFKWGIYPDTPAEIVALIQAYGSADANGRADIVQKLLRGGPDGLRAVLKMAKAEPDPNQRRQLRELSSRKLPAALPPVLAGGQFEKFETLLELAHDGEIVNHNHYTAYWLLRGKLEERIAQTRALLDKDPTRKRPAETLVYLYRANGNLTAARQAAEQSGRPDLLDGILYESADWKALAGRPDVAGAQSDMETWGFRAAYARLAGDRKAFQTALETVENLSKKGTGPSLESDAFTAAKTFLLNDRPAEGLALLAKTPDRHPMLFEVLCARLDYVKAMELADQTRPADSKERDELQILKARTLFVLGEKDKARALFTQLAGQIKDGVDPTWVANLLDAEYRLGLKDQAFEHCVRALSDSLPEGAKLHTPGIYLGKVFPDRADAASVWWSFLRAKYKEETSATVLKRLRELMSGKLEEGTVKAWIEEADRLLPIVKFIAIAPQRQALADVAASAGLYDLARSLLEKADTSEALLRLGDLLADRKQWAAAAERYRQAWQKDLEKEKPRQLADTGLNNPLALYLAGHALVRAGQKTEGDKLIEQSHWVLLGDPSARYEFARALAERGQKEAARREADLLMRVSDPNSFYSGSAVRLLALGAARRKDYQKAAEGYEQSMLRCLHTNTNFVADGAFAGVPAQVHQVRARALLAAGKDDEADKQIELAFLASPGSADLAIALVPDLERRGRKKEAAALFERCFRVLDKLCQDYPRFGWAHNSAAWMSACCRRNLDEALRHAQKAVELSPTNAGYLDTLAEVHFQRGDKEKAVALQKRVIELDPKKLYFRKQLRRLEAGDPSAERPPEEQE
jgi:tetratricopeptide (TPR) repeat protein